MFGLRVSNVCLAIFLLMLAGCGVLFGSGNQPPSDVFYSMEDAYELNENIEMSEVVAIEMREPSQDGFHLSGAHFDPLMLRLVAYIRDDKVSPVRVTYYFEARESGSTTVLFNMEPDAGGPIAVYKRVTLNIGKD